MKYENPNPIDEPLNSEINRIIDAEELVERCHNCGKILVNNNPDGFEPPCPRNHHIASEHKTRLCDGCFAELHEGIE